MTKNNNKNTESHKFSVGKSHHSFFFSSNPPQRFKRPSSTKLSFIHLTNVRSRQKSQSRNDCDFRPFPSCPVHPAFLPRLLLLPAPLSAFGALQLIFVSSSFRRRRQMAPKSPMEFSNSKIESKRSNFIRRPDQYRF